MGKISDVMISKEDVDKAIRYIIQELSIRFKAPSVLKDIEEKCGGIDNSDKVCDTLIPIVENIVLNMDQIFLPDIIFCAKKRTLNMMKNESTRFIAMLYEISKMVFDMSENMLRGVFASISELEKQVSDKIGEYF